MQHPTQDPHVLGCTYSKRRCQPFPPVLRLLFRLDTSAFPLVEAARNEERAEDVVDAVGKIAAMVSETKLTKASRFCLNLVWLTLYLDSGSHDRPLATENLDQNLLFGG